MLGFFLVSGRRNRRDQTDDDDGNTPKTEPVPAMDASAGASRGVRHTVADEEDHPGDPIPQMPTNNDDATQTAANPLQQITPAQWVIAAVVLIAVPVVAYLGTFYLYPYIQDLIEGESPIDTVLAEYGVDEEAETQLLTIRRRRSCQLRIHKRDPRICQSRTTIFRHVGNYRHDRHRSG